MFLPRPSLEQAHVKYVPFPKALFSWLLIFRRFEKRTKAHWAGAGEVVVWCQVLEHNCVTSDKQS